MDAAFQPGHRQASRTYVKRTSMYERAGRDTTSLAATPNDRRESVTVLFSRETHMADTRLKARLSKAIETLIWAGALHLIKIH